MEFNDAKYLIEEFFNGKFEVKKFLGEGSFAKVYLVNHNYLDTLMAMKIVKEPLSPTTNKKDVFHEVMLASQLRHENIINIYDAAEITVGDGTKHAYFLMEYVPGGDLGEFLNSFVENSLFMSVERCLDLTKQILNGLNCLHSANPPIIHRDLKLNNVLLSFNADGDIVIKISDFGFAKEVTTTVSDIDIAGTRPYMAPELFKKEVSTKSDIYAVGVMFYQLLTNHYPYDVDKYSNEELIDLKPWNEDLNAPSFYNENVSDDLDSIVLKCLKKDPLNRYDDAADLLADVEKAIDEINSKQILPQKIINDDYSDDYADYMVNDNIKKAFKLAKCENGLAEAIEILEKEVLKDYDIRRYYNETLRIWKSKRPDLKLISKAFTINLKGKNYPISCDLLREAIAYNPLLKNKYGDYIELWEIFHDLNNHKSLFKSVMLLENLMESSSHINTIYKNTLSILKTYSIEEIVAKSITLAKDNQLVDAANLMEFAVGVNSQIREKYAYKMSLWKQNMKMHFSSSAETPANSIDYGIDLGTSDSLISYYNNGNPIMIKNHVTGEDFTPSAIAVVGGNLEVGAGARQAIFKNSPDAVSEFKRDMGFNLPFTFQETSMEMLPEELSSQILKDLRVSAYSQFGVNVEDAVIAVPANSNPLKTRAVIDAAELAGFKSYNLILEPIAVSLAYGLKKENGVWLIYDMGGSTFNATLIGERNGGIEKIQTIGLDNLGGNTFDWKIVNELFKPKIVSDLNMNDFRQDNPKFTNEFAILKNAAESAKRELTKSDKADILINNLFEGYDFNYTLNRESLRQIMEVLVKHTFDLSRNLLNENSLKDDDIEKIILVGGSTISPLFRDLIADEFDIEIESGLNPLTVVAKGASIYAGSIDKPHRNVGNEELSLFLNYEDGEVKGSVFADDLKSSFLGYFIEFKNDSRSIKIPLNIDGKFTFKSDDEYYDIILHHKDNVFKLDEKSPDNINGGNIHIPYFEKEFRLNESLDINQLSQRYFKLLKDIDYLRDYIDFSENELQDYIETLLEITRKDRNAINHANIYINHLEKIVSQAKNNLEFEVLLENVSGKLEIVKGNELFEAENITEIVENNDLEKLKEIHSHLIDRYVELNRNEVIEQCFFNLKQEGIFTTNLEIADELIRNGHDALNAGDFSKLLDVVNRLYEMDERRVIL